MGGTNRGWCAWSNCQFRFPAGEWWIIVLLDGTETYEYLVESLGGRKYHGVFG